MRTLIIAVSLFLTPYLLSAQAFPKAKWERTLYDFGKITQGKPVTAEFKYSNVGKAPLVITNATGSCGCTVAKYTKEAVEPGKSGSVSATFNAAAEGSFTKTVTVNSNVEGGSEILTIKGEVVKP